jgi:hypothetical protein
VSRKISGKLLIGVAALALAGCGGGSGGPGGPGGPKGTFTNFPLKEGKTTITGHGREATYTADQQGLDLSQFGPSSTVQADVQVDAEGETASVRLKTDSTEKTWDGSNADLDYVGNGKIVRAEAQDGSLIGFADPEVNGFTYQTYGAWLTGNEDSGRVGAFSVGNETAAADIPSSSTATFKGTAAGIYADAAGEDDIMSADAALDVNFATKTAQFSTSNTVLAKGGAAGDLDMSGDLAIGASGLTGNIKTADNSMSGTADGRFYGPGAAEVGGTFELRGQNGAMAGGYGAVKQ